MTGHAQRQHALLSASGAYRWSVCTASARLEDQFPDKGSEAAAEGTLAHELAELKLSKVLGLISSQKLTAGAKKLKQDPLWQKKSVEEKGWGAEIGRHTDSYVEYIQALRIGCKSTPHSAIEQRLDLSSVVPEGFGTADYLQICGTELTVVDLKYGRNPANVVEAANNLQLALYAWGGYEKYKLLYAIESVRMVVYQPRLDNVSEWKVPIAELAPLMGGLKAAADEAFGPSGKFMPGDHCNWCRARAQCRARADESVRLAFATDAKPDLLDPKEVGEYLTLGQQVAKWLKDLEAYALSACLAGKEIPGWKAVEGRGGRQWVDGETAFIRLQEAGVDEAVLYVRTPLSLAQTEKEVGKKFFTETVGDLVQMVPGKPSLKPESDKRKAITNQTAANEVFKIETEEE